MKARARFLTLLFKRILQRFDQPKHRIVIRGRNVEPATRFDLSTRIRVNAYSFVRAVAETSDGTPPLPAGEIDHVLAAYRALRQRRPDLAQGQAIHNIAVELKRAKRSEDAARFYKEVVDSADLVHDEHEIDPGTQQQLRIHVVGIHLAGVQQCVHRQAVVRPGQHGPDGRSGVLAHQIGKLAERRERPLSKEDLITIEADDIRVSRVFAQEPA